MAQVRRQKHLRKLAGTTLKTEALEVLRKKNRELEAELKKAKNNLHRAEKKLMQADIDVLAAKRAWVALFGGVMALSEAVSNTTRAGRNARERARKLLEDEGIRPPSSLGSSRKRHPQKKRRKKKP